MYQFPWHNSIAAILEQLPAQTLLDQKCFFGGGTALVLQAAKGKWPMGGEYRWSEDIDFLCTNDAFRQIGRLVRTGGIKEGIKALIGNDLKLVRDPVIDNYGIRLGVVAPGVDKPIRLEFVCDGDLPSHTPGDIIHGITCLSLTDSTAHKLMANSIRWNDRAVALRDYIDLMAISAAQKGLPPAGYPAAIDAFTQEEINLKLTKAHELLATEGYIGRCQQELHLPDWTVKCLQAFAQVPPEHARETLLSGITFPANVPEGASLEDVSEAMSKISKIQKKSPQGHGPGTKLEGK
jgi:hypothetical protein